MKCARCGKAFTVTYAGWGYRYGGKYACSYSCMRAMERGGFSVNPEERVKVDELDGRGLGKDEIVEQTGLSRAQVGAYLGRKHRKEISGDAREAVRETGELQETDELKRSCVRILNEMIRLQAEIIGLLKRLM